MTVFLNLYHPPHLQSQTIVDKVTVFWRSMFHETELYRTELISCQILSMHYNYYAHVNVVVHRNILFGCNSYFLWLTEVPQKYAKISKSKIEIVSVQRFQFAHT